MAKKEFIKKRDSNVQRHNPVTETEILAPDAVFDLESFSKAKKANEISTTPLTRPIGRPVKGKKYGTIRIQRSNLHRVNALQNTLGFETQDEIISDLLDSLEKTLVGDQRTVYEMYMKTYFKRDEKNNK